MKFDELDTRMRRFEIAHDRCVPPGVYIVVRLDGRGFTQLTKERHPFTAPFDERFRDLMLTTVEHLLACGVDAIYGYTQSDEISLLLHQDAGSFGRKHRKLCSVLAGEASACFSLGLGELGVFDGRVSELPAPREVIDYFRWRAEDAQRNCLTAHCYWQLRQEGQSAGQATAALAHLGRAQKVELLHGRGIEFDGLPAWQRHGLAVWHEQYEKEGLDPRTGQPTVARRRRLRRDLSLPVGAGYDEFLQGIVAAATTPPEE